jgi:peptide deformylase
LSKRLTYKGVRMAILKIARMGHPVLSQKAVEVKDPTAPRVRRLAEDMIETLIDADGAGLAAPQVHVSLRLIVFQAPGEAGTGLADETTAPMTVLINPVLEVLSAETEGDWEGCLSLAGLRGFVVRASRIRYRGLDLDGTTIVREASGFHARVVQHEYDHLEGILYPQQMGDMRKFIFQSEAKHWQKPAE